MTGQRFERWLVLERAGRDQWGNALWRCRCDCGTERVLEHWNLTTGHSKSCGCLKRELAAAASMKHGHSVPDEGHGTPEYRSWRSMIGRCHNPSAVANFPNYAGRGIVVCAAWRESFAAFLAHVGPHPGKGYSIDRIDVNGNYEPGNVRWATLSQQARNKRHAALKT